MDSLRQMKKVDQILDQVLDLPTEEQSEFLKKACAGNTELRIKVEKLLSHRTMADKFLDTTQPLRQSLEDAIVTGEEPLADKTLGAYRILREIGRGGMGKVYLATRADGQFERKVAIKVIAPGKKNREFLNRFEQERRILGGLLHPNIAQLLDSGFTPKGHPYFIMEYVEGFPIHDYCDRNLLSVKDRLGLFIKVCEAVQYAHQTLVIHRDIKPTNILVTEEGRAKLLDFGIAKIVDPESYSQPAITLTGHALLTPECASPEQLLGNPVTTASDVYSLGSLLYLLLTGCLPIRVQGRLPAQLIEDITKGRPEMPSKMIGDTVPNQKKPASASEIAQLRQSTPGRLRRSLSGDLDAIVLKALNKDPSQRYSSVERMVQDIRYYLKGMPVSALPDSLGYRTRKYIKRHKFGVVAFLVFSITCFGLLLSISIQSTRIIRERNKAEQVSRFLQQMLLSPDPGNNSRHVKVVDVLDRVSANVSKDFANDPEMAATLQRVLGRTYLSLGQYDQARILLAEAAGFFSRSMGPYHLETLTNEVELGEALMRLGRYEEAQNRVERVIAIGSRRFTSHHRLILKARLTAAEILNARARFQEAAQLAKPLLAQVMDRLGDRDPLTRDCRDALATAYEGLGNWEESEELFRIIYASSIQHLGDTHPDTLSDANNLAITLYQLNKYQQAEQIFRQCWKDRKAVLGEDHPDTLETAGNLATTLEQLGQLREAETIHRETLSLETRKLGLEHPNRLSSLNNLAAVLMDQGRYEEAENLYAEAIRLKLKVLGSDHRSTIISMSNHALSLEKLNRDHEAKNLHRQAVAAFSRALGPSHPHTLLATSRLVNLLCRKNELQEAEQLARDALDKAGKAFEPTFMGFLKSEQSLVMVLEKKGDLAAAADLARTNLQHFREALEPGHQEIENAVERLSRIEALLNGNP